MKAAIFYFLIALQIVNLVFATSRPFASNDVPSVHQSVAGQNLRSLQVPLKSNEGFDKNGAYDMQVVSKIGSSRPNCEHKCYGCIPCEAIQVPTTSFAAQYTNYEPESWKCKCGPSIYSP